MRVVLKAACLVLLVAATGCSGSRKDDMVRNEQTTADGLITGAVKYVNLEGGFYGIVTDTGQKLDPVNLPGPFKEDGLRIRARVEKVTGGVSSRMWGSLVRVVAIERL